MGSDDRRPSSVSGGLRCGDLDLFGTDEGVRVDLDPSCGRTQTEIRAPGRGKVKTFELCAACYHGYWAHEQTGDSRSH